MLRGRNWLRKLAAPAGLACAALLGCAGTVGASTSQPVGAGWTADPDDQFLLDVRIRQLRLGDGVRANNTPEGTCVVFGDFLATLDVPMKIDLTAKRASGWAFKENNKVAIDLAARAASYGGKSEPIAAGTVRETPEGWCVDSAALGRCDECPGSLACAAHVVLDALDGATSEVLARLTLADVVERLNAQAEHPESQLISLRVGGSRQPA
jgi:hypothetical protein